MQGFLFHFTFKSENKIPEEHPKSKFYTSGDHIKAILKNPTLDVKYRISFWSKLLYCNKCGLVFHNNAKG